MQLILCYVSSFIIILASLKGGLSTHTTVKFFPSSLAFLNNWLITLDFEKVKIISSS